MNPTHLAFVCQVGNFWTVLRTSNFSLCLYGILLGDIFICNLHNFFLVELFVIWFHNFDVSVDLSKRGGKWMHEFRQTCALCYRSFHYMYCVFFITCNHNYNKSSSSLVFSPKAGFGRNQSPVRRPVWLWHTAF